MRKKLGTVHRWVHSEDLFMVLSHLWSLIHSFARFRTEKMYPEVKRVIGLEYALKLSDFGYELTSWKLKLISEMIFR